MEFLRSTQNTAVTGMFPRVKNTCFYQKYFGRVKMKSHRQR